MKYLLRFDVTGKFYFPLEMLATDDCFPGSLLDAQAMHPCREGFERTIRLHSYRAHSLSALHIDAWKKVKWTVSIVSIDPVT